MKVIGFRAFPDGFSYVVLNGTQTAPGVLAFNRLTFPKNSGWPASLSWLRKQVTEILTQHRPKGASFKGVERNARTKSARRYHVEAVIQEVTYSSRQVQCNERVKSQIRRDIDNFTDPAKYLTRVLDGMAELRELNKPAFQEAALAAIAELPSE